MKPAIAGYPSGGSWYAAEDIDRLVRELDVAWNGEGAARQAMLCDIVAQIVGDIRNGLTIPPKSG